MLEGIGWQVTQCGVQTHVVVEADDVVSDVAGGLGVVGVVALPDTLHLQVQEETLYDGIDAPMSSRRCRVFQIGQDKWVQLANDVTL